MKRVVFLLVFFLLLPVVGFADSDRVEPKYFEAPVATTRSPWRPKRIGLVFATGTNALFGDSVNFTKDSLDSWGKWAEIHADFQPLDGRISKYVFFRSGLGIGTTENIDSGSQFPTLTGSVGLRLEGDYIFVETSLIGLAYAPLPHSGSDWQFPATFTVGWRAHDGFDLGLTFQHYSNGGFKEPNYGGNWLGIKIAVEFDSDPR